ncbi:MAG: DUF3343 domain-containing protein [Bacteroidota bacterium]
MKTELLLFPSVHWVIKAEKLLESRGISTRIIAVPKSISSDCGMCLSFGEGEAGRSLEILRKEGFQVEKVSL